ncbi:erythromycin resistance leader peptide [Staphylococcus aureus]
MGTFSIFVINQPNQN